MKSSSDTTHLSPEYAEVFYSVISVDKFDFVYEISDCHILKEAQARCFIRQDRYAGWKNSRKRYDISCLLLSRQLKGQNGAKCECAMNNISLYTLIGICIRTSTSDLNIELEKH